MNHVASTDQITMHTLAISKDGEETKVATTTDQPVGKMPTFECIAFESKSEGCFLSVQQVRMITIPATIQQKMLITKMVK